MIKEIQKIKGFGVFANYTRPAGMDTFAEKNIIYGWNYSGKTTLSRIFYTLEAKKIHPDYVGATFTINDGSAISLTESGLEGDTKIVRVFNSDFIDRNLSWDGSAFTPILLLGEESIEIEKKIKESQTQLLRCRDGYKHKRDSAATIVTEISDKKTKAAKHIKTTLSLVEAFTATHLNNTIAIIDAVDAANFILSSADAADLLKRALSSEKDKLEVVRRITLPAQLEGIAKRCNDLLSKVPAFSRTIDHLRENPAVANWVEQGVHLHENSASCEFCGNNIDVKRMESLRAHFSKDLAEYRGQLQKALGQVEGARISYQEPGKGVFYPDLRDNATNAIDALKTAVQAFNFELEKLVVALKNKLDAPFEHANIPTISIGPETSVRVAVDNVNAVSDRNNEITANFGKEKNNAVTAMKNHYVAEFIVRENLTKLELKKTIREKHQKKFQLIGEKFKAGIADLEAKINLAQKGREEMNGHIANLIGSSAIQIEVVNEGHGDRFRLIRRGTIAKNLSEGEKTAIAFSFFLSKLREIKNLEDAIIYIDDPISSLDSNHIFQVNAIIRDLFFYQDQNTANKEWKTKCKQIFISTHNFEFFTLLRELPGNQNKTRFYQVKRISPELSELTNLPASIIKYSSEYHYLYSVIHKFHHSMDKGDLELLLSVPNAVRRFVELYTFARIPTGNHITVDMRFETLFGPLKAKRILKVLHHFSHLNNIERLSKNTDLICDIENAVADLMNLIKEDKFHFDALEESVT